MSMLSHIILENKKRVIEFKKVKYIDKFYEKIDHLENDLDKEILAITQTEQLKLNLHLAIFVRWSRSTRFWACVLVLLRNIFWSLWSLWK